ncbi:5-formyltetrahydrofolate cyclo-ligase [Abyssalbus ytuae]|uniref:5-formyltetrahydrofolate cyclo-ligase n=1 Tax=Abyssalbus ytuae TaxID=2926907 RepID=A0A9E6ZRC5_9FLAO|nr:5-formyltetrahydrofolate cyclo-ligase [Abyssalbus ytuae]UOB19140.1 5-formyltetrahydrofolate cyclo-ligase [Abyssalbus ytuae]
MHKTELRKKYKSLRNKLSLTTIEDLSIDIANQLLKVPVWNKTYYHLFLPITEQKEVDTSFILSVLQGKDKEVIISKSNFENHTLSHFLLTENTKLIKNGYNIPEPADGIEVPESKIEVVFIPLLAFDHSGNRVGYGKGFYDRFLSKCNPDAIKVGLSFFEAENKPVTDAHSNDVKMDYCVTPGHIYCFNK